MKKKVLALILGTMLVLSLAACGGSEETEDATATEAVRDRGDCRYSGGYRGSGRGNRRDGYRVCGRRRRSSLEYRYDD